MLLSEVVMVMVMETEMARAVRVGVGVMRNHPVVVAVGTHLQRRQVPVPALHGAHRSHYPLDPCCQCRRSGQRRCCFPCAASEARRLCCANLMGADRLFARV